MAEYMVGMSLILTEHILSEAWEPCLACQQSADTQKALHGGPCLASSQANLCFNFPPFSTGLYAYNINSMAIILSSRHMRPVWSYVQSCL